MDDDSTSDPRIFLNRIRQDMRQLRSKPFIHRKNRILVHKEQNTCTHVFLRVDSIKRSLTQPYTGPHRIVERIKPTVFRINVNGRLVNMSSDRLKPAFLISKSNESFTTSISQSQPERSSSNPIDPIRKPIK